MIKVVLIISMISIAVSLLAMIIYVAFYKRHINKRLLGTSKVKHFIAPIYLFLVVIHPFFLLTSIVVNIVFDDVSYGGLIRGDREGNICIDVDNQFSGTKRIYLLKYKFLYVDMLGDSNMFAVKNQNHFSKYMKSLAHFISYQEISENEYYLFYLEETYLVVTKEKNSDVYFATESSIKIVNNGDSIPIVPNNIFLLSNDNSLIDYYGYIDVNYSFAQIKEFYQRFEVDKIYFNDEKQTVIINCLNGNIYTLFYQDYKLKISLN